MSYKGKKGSKVYASREGYNLYAQFYDEKKKFMNSFEGYDLQRLMPDLTGKKVLDLGAGTGRHIELLKKNGASEIVAVDHSEKMLEILMKKHRGVEGVFADAENLPFEDESFDFVLAAFLLMHIADPADLFREIYRILKPGGVLVMTNINQRKAPDLKVANGESIVIKTFYHMPEKLIEGLKYEFFDIEENGFVYEEKFWINQIIKAKK